MMKSLKPNRLKTGYIVLGITLLSSFAGAALAGKGLTVEKNHTARIMLSAPAGSVIVGNPAIADVTVVDSRTVYIVGKGYGRSAVTITDNNGRAIWDGNVTVGSPARGSVTIFKGMKPTTLVCSNVCVEQSNDDAAAQSVTSNAAVSYPSPNM
jgi:Flp pilus assembly secretin CpaC